MADYAARMRALNNNMRTATDQLNNTIRSRNEAAGRARELQKRIEQLTSIYKSASTGFNDDSDTVSTTQKNTLESLKAGVKKSSHTNVIVAQIQADLELSMAADRTGSEVISNITAEIQRCRTQLEDANYEIRTCDARIENQRYQISTIRHRINETREAAANQG